MGGRLQERPFSTLDGMHEAIKTNWNRKVTNADHVYILGDIGKTSYLEKLTAYLSQLKGNLHLITGNHDEINDLRIKRLFTEICDYKELSDNFGGNSYHLVLCHYPIYAWNGQHKNAIHLYGHTHDNCDDKAYQEAIARLNEIYKDRDGENYVPFYAYNVGCMHWNYEPVTLKEILATKGSDATDNQNAKQGKSG